MKCLRGPTTVSRDEEQGTDGDDDGDYDGDGDGDAKWVDGGK